MNIILLLFFCMIVISQSIDLDDYNNFVFECYKKLKEDHWKWKTWMIHHRKHNSYHRTRGTHYDHNWKTYDTFQSFYHPIDGIHTHYTWYRHNHDGHNWWWRTNYHHDHHKTYDYHNVEPRGFYSFGMKKIDQTKHRRGNYVERKYEDCFVKCIMEKIGVYVNGVWQPNTIVSTVGGIDAVTKATAAKCVLATESSGTECQKVYKAVKCYLKAMSIDTCKPKR